MTALELRLIGYGLLALILIGGAGTAGYKLAANHYQREMQAEELAQQSAVAAAQEKTAAVVAQQQAASVAAEKQYDDLKGSATTLGDELASSLRQYAALRRVPVSTPSTAPTEPHAAGQGASGDQGVAGLAGQAAQACLEDAAELTALQSWAAGISKQ